MSIIKLSESAYSKKFKNLIYSHDRYIIAYGGRGSGKTESLYIKYLLELFQPYYFRLAYINKEFRNIRDSQYAGFKRVAKSVGLFHKLKFFDGDYRIVNPQNGNSLIPKGMDDPEKTKGLDEVTAIWWDEISKSNKVEDFTTLNALLRTPKAKYLQFAISFNPVSQDHWLRKYFFKEENAHELKEIFKPETYLNHSTYLDNEFIDQKAYEKTLIQNSNENPNAYLVNILGDWGIITNQNPFFYAFNYKKHFINKEYEISPLYNLDISFDFNFEPCTCVVGQSIPHLRQYNIIRSHYASANNHKSSLEILCDEIKKTYLPLTNIARIRITGDAAGKQRSADTAANVNKYTQILKYLGITNKRAVNVESFNIDHKSSRDICNDVLNIADIKFYSGTQTLIENIKASYADEKGSLNKCKKELGIHDVDAWRYLIKFWFAFRLNGKNFKNYQRNLSPNKTK